MSQVSGPVYTPVFSSEIRMLKVCVLAYSVSFSVCLITKTTNGANYTVYSVSAIPEETDIVSEMLSCK